MSADSSTTCTAFEGYRRIASGDLLQVALAVKAVVDRGEQAPILIVDDASSRPIEIDLRGTAADLRARLTPPPAAAPLPSPAPEAPRGPGRPKLGVVAREVTLLPRHWEWLNARPGGASVALRKLVEDAKRASAGKDRVRQAQDASYRFMTAIAGNQPGFEDATRALFAGDAPRFDALILRWPVDIGAHLRKIAAAAFAADEDSQDRSKP
jgi:hypothetical protein